MKRIFALLGLLYSSFSHANLIGMSGNFETTDISVIEKRSDGTTWEWLRLDLTNGIKFHRIRDDLADDGDLNNSIAHLYQSNDFRKLGAIDGALDDLLSLSEAQTSSWSLVDGITVVEMLNSFFGLDLTPQPLGDGIYYYTEALPLFVEHSFGADIALADEFIDAFGLTWSGERNEHGYNYEIIDTYTVFTTSGFTNNLINSYGHSRIFVSTSTSTSNYSLNRIHQGIDADDRSISPAIGTWLVREVNVSEPPVAILLIGMVLAPLLRLRR